MITEEAEYDIQFSTTLDEPVMQELLRMPEVGKWYPPSTQEEFSVFVRNWIGFSRYKSSLTAFYRGELVGVVTIFLMPYKKVAHMCMLYMVVAPKFQRKGIGFSLLKNAKHLAKNRFHLESMHVEIFGGCPIIPLLQKSGFKRLFTQKGFVHFEDGFVPREVWEVKL